MSYLGQKTVLMGRDCEALDILINMHAEGTPLKILDATYGKGTMWKKCGFSPDVRMDIRSLPNVNLVGDFTIMKDVGSGSMDVIVFDPPHLPTHAASENSSKIWEDRYGITGKDELRKGDNVSPMFALFLKRAKEVLTPNGIILAKIADLVHNHRYQWQQFDFIKAVFEAGMTPCDMLIKVDPQAGRLKSSKWKKQSHFRKGHCYWIVVRKGKRCERP